MKKYCSFFAIVIASIIMTSCAVTRPRIVEAIFTDFRPYTEMGFYLSPDPYTLPHDVLGELSINIYPAIHKNGSIENPKMKISSPFKNGSTSKEGDNHKYVDATYSKTDYQPSAYSKENISSEEMLEIAVSYAKSLGANGISDFEVSAIYNTYTIGRSIHTELDHYKIYGACILRK